MVLCNVCSVSGGQSSDTLRLREDYRHTCAECALEKGEEDKREQREL